MNPNQNWRNKTSLREKYSLMNLLGKATMEVADPIAYIDFFPETSAADAGPEEKN